MFSLFAAALFALAGCSAGNSDYNDGKKAEAIEDYDTAVVHFQRALQADPTNAEYKLYLYRSRFEAAQRHAEEGQKLEKSGDLQMAMAEFQKATMIDPSNPIAQEELDKTVKAIAAKNATTQPAPAEQGPQLMSGPPELQPLPQTPINLSMTADAKMVFDAVAKLGGLTVLFDPDYTTRRVAIDLRDVTIEQALDIVALEAKAFWKPITNNVIFVAPDQQQKRRDYEEEIVRTIYLKNTIQPQDITEIINGLRQILDLTRIQQFNAQNAIIVRGTPAKVMLAEKLINDLDQSKAEVVIQFDVLQASRNRMRDLGINPGSAAASLSFTPGGCTNSTTTANTTTPTGTLAGLALNQLRSLGTSDYCVTLPNATATALLTDSQTRVLDDPQLRIVDGQDAKLNIGEKIPIATGSFQAGVGVGAAGVGGGLVNPLVNTQFQYIQTGVIVDVTPRIHPETREVSLKLSIEVSSVSGSENIGGINQPIINTNQVQNDVRLKDGEVNLLGGLMETTYSRTKSGFAGLSQIPFLNYLTADNTLNTQDQEVVIVVRPQIIRVPNITEENLRALASGTETYPGSRLASEATSPPIPAGAAQAAPTPAAPAAPAPAPVLAKLDFNPASVTVKPGETTTVGVTVQDAQDLYSVPMLLQYDPKVISVEDVQQGAFLSGGGAQAIPLVKRIDKDMGQVIVSLTRPPNAPGVSGSGTIFNLVVKGVAAGTSPISILQVNARDSQQRALQFTTNAGAVKVQP